MMINRLFGSCLLGAFGLAANCAYAQYLQAPLQIEVPQSDTSKIPPAQLCFVSTLACSSLAKVAPRPCRIETNECGAIGDLVAVSSKPRTPKRSP